MMKQAVIRFKRKLGNSWGLTLLVGSFLISVASAVFLNFPGAFSGQVNPYDWTQSVAGLLAVLALLGFVVQLLCAFGFVFGFILLVREKAQMRRAGSSSSLNRSKSIPRNTRGRLVLASSGFAALLSGLLYGTMRLAAPQATLLSGSETTGIGAGMIFGVPILGLAFISAVLFFLGAAFSIAHEVKRRDHNIA